ncbi:MFS transporter [[Clostridium] fimetarium]|uniref:Glycosyl hydrolases family 2 n=1 Tax=[Clostridium] fimetarium TaxID=99656 RepID=A0A1I0PES0_9FIRM|nr:MFS transporter [[Clostridium] fimetarium]SEW12829.1 Glycosyl hydrolases family 2 [[Clostridium] fimetarium]
MKTKLSGKFWFTLVIFSLIGQVAWVVENMYFNVFVYKMFHASAGQISLMVAASAVSATVTTLIIGALSDKIGKRKIFICTGYIAWGISILSFAFIRVDVIHFLLPGVVATATVGITLVIILDCVMTFFGSSANDACYNAWLTDKTDETNRGSVEGINAMMPLVAILVVFGGFMFFDLDNQKSWITIYFIIGIAVIAIGILGFFLIEEKKIVTSSNQNYFQNILYGFRPAIIKKNPILYFTLGAFAIFGISIQTYMPYLILYYEKALGMSNYVLIMAPAITLAAIITAFYGKLYDRKGFKKSIIPAIIILMTGYVFLYLFKDTGLVFLGSLLMMTGYLTGMAVFGAMIRDYTPRDKTGLFQGLRIIGQVFIPGIIGPAIGAAILADAATCVNGDGTTSFIPNEKIFMAAFIAAFFIWILLIWVFRLVDQEHVDLMTEDGEHITSRPWQEYPRPQLKRDSYINLNGKWKYAATYKGHAPSVWNQEILLPFPPQSILSGIKKFPNRYKYLYYQREFILPENFVKDRVILNFGASDQITTVYINHKEILTHIGGYLPFQADITDYIQKTNTITVKVKDTLNHSLPYGKQKSKRGGMWYTTASGIWQSVWLESVSRDYIKNLKITPTLTDVTIEISSDMVSKAESKAESKADSKAGSTASSRTIKIKTEYGVIEKIFEGNKIVIPIENPKVWSPQQPYLYEFEIKTEGDRVTSYFALRTLSVQTVENIPRLCLNGKPYFFHGILDQGYYSDGIYLPASPAGYEKDIQTMKELGFNTLRKHIKVEPAIYYYLCDKLGMVVFQDMINNGLYSFIRDTAFPTIGLTNITDWGFLRTKKVKSNFKAFAKETIEYLYNFPSICYWTIFNEGWGQFQSDDMYDMIKELDSTRFIDSTSGWFWQKKSDVDSYHIYFKSIRVKKSKRPIVLSEFGGYCLKAEEHSFNLRRTYGYRFYKEGKELQEALNGVYFGEIAEEIQNGLCGSIYTQVSDVEDETNGLFTYDRKILKVDAEEMKKIAKGLKI